MWEGKQQETKNETSNNPEANADAANDNDDDDFGDDFDEFAEEGGDDDDFGDFDEADAEETPVVGPIHEAQQAVHTSLAGLVSSYTINASHVDHAAQQATVS
jgi:hypothetical protein